jgi:inositol hexakisphosphate/diphosphoinositol-pentakisphosphate kinase
VATQHVLLDRTAVYAKLRANGIPVPSYEIYHPAETSPSATPTPDGFKRMLVEQTHEEPTPEEIQAASAATSADTEGEDARLDAERRTRFWGDSDPIQENEDCITVNGHKFKKPFVEKPVYAEDHNVYVYYPRSSGGGSKRLFRKIADRSSKFFPAVSTVRRGGSFIYEEFVSTDGMDIKVYTVGPEYAHAEARKAPTVDGRVKRTAEGKEVRYHVILTQQEKEIARKITQIFGQNICGFDLLRSDGISYVCDVNGWSFVKGQPKYYNDVAQILYEMIQFYLHPDSSSGLSRASRLLQDNDCMLQSTAEFGPSRGKQLRCLLAVVRHGDRTPKQKVKVKVSHPKLLAFFDGKDPHAQVKLKSVKEMEEFAAVISAILEEANTATPPPQPNHAKASFSSNVRSKYSPSSRASSPGTETREASPVAIGAQLFASLLDENARARLQEINEELTGSAQFSGINRKVQIKPLSWQPSATDESVLVVSKALMIFKFGGQLTDHGFKQADFLGKRFRTKMYSMASGMLSLHSSFAHDVKFYASDEGRVQMTAAVFARAFLELDEEELIPILYALVWNDHRANMLLEHSCSDSTAMMGAKRQLAAIMNSDIDFSADNKDLDPTQLISGMTVEELRKLGLGKIGNPYRRLCEMHAKLVSLHGRFREALQSVAAPSKLPLLTRISNTWGQLTKAFYDEQRQRFDISKVPEIADALRFLVLHSARSLGIDFVADLKLAYNAVLPLAKWVVQ